MTTPTDTMNDQALKAKHRAMWAMGDYPAVAAEIIPDLGRILVEACGITRGQRVLDVAAGTGNAAIPAALAGARVTATDLTPTLLEAGRALAENRGTEVQWQEADAEALPFADGEFDAVLSCVGVIFAPHHQASADEIVRVCAQPPPLCGDESHLRALLGERVTDVVVSRQAVRVDRFATAEQFREYFKANYGPTIAVYRNIADDDDRIATLDGELDDLARRHAITPGSATMDWEYLLLTARTRDPQQD